MKSSSKNKEGKFSKLLLSWREKNNFDSLYPWRNSNSKYEVLLSEILLKKTTKRQVAKEWENVVSHYKNFQELKKADLKKLKKVLRPLGLEHTRYKHLRDLSKKNSQ